MRERLFRTFETPRVALIIAGPGTGKTTLMAQLCRSWSGEVFWLSVDQTDGDPNNFRRSMAAAFTGEQPQGAEQMLADLERSRSPLLVLDDLHEIEHSEALELVGELVRFRPESTTLVLTMRRMNGVPAGTWVSEPGAAMLTHEDLRFRSWEVNRLLQDSHGISLSPAQLHRLTRATDGWAVALHLFGLKARHLTPSEQGVLIENIGSSGQVRDYLLEQVFIEFDVADIEFLRQVSVFSVLGAEACDQYLNRSGSSGILRRLERGGLLVDAPDGTFSMHRLVRAHFRRELVEQHGRAETESRFRRCGDVLDRLGQRTAARTAWAMAGQSESPERRGKASESEPWVLLGLAERRLVDGQLAEARETLAAVVEVLAEEEDPAPTRHRIRLLDDWLDPPPGQAVTWPMHLRRVLAAQSSPNSPAQSATGYSFSHGIALLLGGNLTASQAQFRRVAERDDGPLRLLAILGVGVAAAFGGDFETSRSAAEDVLDTGGRLGWPALVRVADALRLVDVPEAPLDGFVAHCEAASDQLGAAAIRLLYGMAAPDLEEREEVLAEAARLFAAKSLALPALIADSAAALASERAPQFDGLAEREVRRLGLLPLMLWSQARRRRPASTPPPETEFDYLLGNLSRHAAGGDLTSTIRFRCLGSLVVMRGDQEVKLDDLRPKHLELLRIMACHGPDWVHRSKLIGWLWPNTSEQRAVRSLQTAISAIRRTIDKAGTATSILERSGERYRLALPADAFDLGALEETMRSIGAGLDIEQALILLKRLSAAAGAELVPGSGPSEWAIEYRRSFQQRLAKSIGELLKLIPDRIIVENCHLLVDIVERITPADPLWATLANATNTSSMSSFSTDLQDRQDRWLQG